MVRHLMQHLGKLSFDWYCPITVCRHEQIVYFRVNDGAMRLAEIDATVGCFLGMHKFWVRPNTHGHNSVGRVSQYSATLVSEEASDDVQQRIKNALIEQGVGCVLVLDKY